MTTVDSRVPSSKPARKYSCGLASEGPANHRKQTQLTGDARPELHGAHMPAASEGRWAPEGVLPICLFRSQKCTCTHSYRSRTPMYSCRPLT